ncbi:MAG: hypothetical protein PHN49_00665 [Candidatus Omnitrophica bacterium]|nr:hypothetical protein [Candidatus Omnitrophota bacterium]MDD5670134.1 hypothetical protein [Candidatus Omnitrophota bacterium]
MNKFGQAVLILTGTFILLGTTYVLKENGVETGRVESNDGKNEVQVIEGGRGKDRTAETPQPAVPQAAVAVQPQVTDGIPDKVETLKSEDGHDVLKITGQKSDDYYAALHRERKEAREKARLNHIERVDAVKIPKTLYRSAESNQKPFTDVITSDNFVIEIENNKILGQKTAQLLEAFYALFRKEMNSLVERPEDSDLLSVKIVEGKNHYKDYCKDNQLECDHTMGISMQSVLAKRSHRDVFYTNTVVFFWDEKGEHNYFRVLFHEVTHQLLSIHTQKQIPRWFTEGLAVYFGNVRFDKKEVYVPKFVVNPYMESMKDFLAKDGDPKAIFAWNARGANELAYYGLSGSLVFFLMRNRNYRNYVDDLVMELRGGRPAEKLGDYLIEDASPGFWKEWYATFTDYVPLPGTKLFYFE